MLNVENIAWDRPPLPGATAHARWNVGESEAHSRMGHIRFL